MHLLAPLAALMLIAGCAAPAFPPTSGTDVAALLLGEQHDAAEHQELHRQVVEGLAGRGLLAAVLLEMADTGTSTAALPAQATEEQVRQALHWNNEAWPWPAYGPAVMAAVRSGVPALGANLPGERMRAAMADIRLEALLPPAELAAQQQAIRQGHCNLLPETQIAPMTRVQIARDQAMARAIAAAVQHGRTVVLLAGAGHVDPALGVPRHLPAGLAAKAIVLPAPAGPPKDYCTQLRRQLAQ